MNKGGKPMTTREMVTSLMHECLEDASYAIYTVAGAQVTPDAHANATATLAAALFAARWAMICHRAPIYDVGTEKP